MSVIEKTGFFISILAIFALVFFIAFSKRGVLDYKTLKAKEASIIEQNRVIDMENKKLENEINGLKTDLDYIRHVAKQEHDMAEEGELIFKVKSPKKKE